MLPATLLSAVEAHTCFTGSYRYESPVAVCTDPAQPLLQAVQVSCSDCFSFHVASLASHLPAGMTGHTLANELSAHMRALRGYRWSISGYHLSSGGGGFWLSAASLTESLFLADGSRNHPRTRTEAELLAEAFRQKVAPHHDARLLDPAQYSIDFVHIDLTTPLPPVKSRQDVLAAAQCSPSPTARSRRVAVLELLPVATAVVPPPAPVTTSAIPTAASIAAAPPAPASASVAASAMTTPRRPPTKKLQIGDVCPLCRAEYRERPLFTGSFIGCLC
jgi:hypothetical protein